MRGRASAHGPRSLLPPTALADPETRRVRGHEDREHAVPIHLDDREDARAIEAGGEPGLLDREAVDDALTRELRPGEGIAPALGTEDPRRPRRPATPSAAC